MAQESSFFNAQLVNGSYDRVYNAENWAAYFASFLGNGVSVNPATGLQVQAGSGMNVIVAIGTAFINGYRYANTMPLGVTINMANATYPRITSVILELNLNDRSILVKTLDGTPSNTPVAPTLTRTTGIYQLQLATILIPAGTTQITTGNITDTRADISVCGFIKGLFGENQSITTAEEIKKIKEQIANLDNTYLTANSSPTLMNNWTFGYNDTLYFNNSSGSAIIGFQTEDNTQFTMFNPMTNNCLFYLYPVTSSSDTDTISWNCNNTFQDSVTITENGYLYFENESGKNILCAQVDQNEFSISNSITGNNLVTVTPVSSGIDTLNVPANINFSGEVSFNGSPMISTTTLPTMNLSAVDYQENQSATASPSVVYQFATDISYTTFAITKNHGVGSLLINITVSSILTKGLGSTTNLLCQLPNEPFSQIAKGSYAGVLYYGPGTTAMGFYDTNYDTISSISSSSFVITLNEGKYSQANGYENGLAEGQKCTFEVLYRY